VDQVRERKLRTQRKTLKKWHSITRRGGTQSRKEGSEESISAEPSSRSRRKNYALQGLRQGAFHDQERGEGRKKSGKEKKIKRVAGTNSHKRRSAFLLYVRRKVNRDYQIETNKENEDKARGKKAVPLRTE